MIPLIAASEKGTGQTESAFEKKLEMWWRLSLSYREEVFWKEALQRVIVPYSKIIWYTPTE